MNMITNVLMNINIRNYKKIKIKIKIKIFSLFNE